MNTISVSSLQELIEKIVEINSKKTFWFRGHSSTDYWLVPSSQREFYLITNSRSIPCIPKLVRVENCLHGDCFFHKQIYLDYFCKKIDSLDAKYAQMSLLEKYEIAQHYGIPTPLLDWSTDATVGLFFAIDGRKEGEDCCLIMMDPGKMNSLYAPLNHKDQTPIDTALDIATANRFVFNFECGACAFEGNKIDKRLCRQSGNFTYHSSTVTPLGSDCIYKIIIPNLVAEELANVLDKLGIDSESIYVGKRDDEALTQLAQSIPDECEDEINSALAEYRKEAEKYNIY